MTSLLPVIQQRVARVVLRKASLRGRDVRQEVRDLTHDVFVSVLADGGAILLRWDPALGRSLANYVGWHAERFAASRLRVKSATQESLAVGSECESADEVSVRTTPFEQALVSRDLLVRLLAWLERSLTPRGREMFERLFVREESVQEICESLSLKPEAVYQWRRTLTMAAERGLAALQAEAADDRQERA